MIITALGFDILLLLVSVLGILRYKKLHPAFKALVWLASVTLILALLEKVYIRHYRNSAPFTHLDAISNFSFISFAYYKLFIKKAVKKMAQIVIIGMVLFFFINAIWLQPFFHQFSTNSSVSTLLIFEIFSLLLFKQMLSYPLKINITRQSVFWFNIAVLFYSTTMFLNFALENYYAKHMVNDNSLFYFWYFLLYVFFILMGFSLLIDKKESYLRHAE